MPHLSFGLFSHGCRVHLASTHRIGLDLRSMKEEAAISNPMTTRAEYMDEKNPKLVLVDLCEIGILGDEGESILSAQPLR